MAQTILITGANRGIGLALTREYARRGHTVFAACRHPDKAEELNNLHAERPESLTVLRLDVTRSESIGRAAEAVWGSAGNLDILINNAGIFPEPSGITKLTDLELQDCLDAFETNVLGALRVTRAMLPLLETGTRPCVANVTSATGCIADKTGPGYYAYGTSKAALNYVTRAMAAEFKESALIVIAISPGWVKTAMGGPDAELTPEKSAKGIVDTIAKLTTNDTSCWFNWDGKKRDSW